MKKSLPNKFIVLDCPDKNDEEWTPKRSLANFPCPYRCLLAGTPNCGKSTLIKNLLLQARPLYDRLIIVCCSKDTKDFDELEPSIVLDKLPSLESFDRNYKNCLILDDYKPKTSVDKANLDRVFGFVSSHCNTTVIMACQDLFSISSPTIRRMSNVFFLWKSFDEQQLNMISKRVGMASETIKTIMKDLDFGKRDSLCIDMTSNSPAILRKNIYEKIDTKYIPDL